MKIQVLTVCFNSKTVDGLVPELRIFNLLLLSSSLPLQHRMLQMEIRRLLIYPGDRQHVRFPI